MFAAWSMSRRANRPAACKGKADFNTKFARLVNFGGKGQNGGLPSAEKSAQSEEALTLDDLFRGKYASDMDVGLARRELGIDPGTREIVFPDPLSVFARTFFVKSRADIELS